MNVNEFIARNIKVPRRVRLSQLAPKRWAHLLTQVGTDVLPPYEIEHTAHTDAKSPPSDQGFTVWSRRISLTGETDGINESPALIAWDWVAIRAGVIARSNVQQVATNMELIGEDEQPIQSALRSIVFAALIHGLPWQARVLREIQSHDSGVST